MLRGNLPPGVDALSTFTFGQLFFQLSHSLIKGCDHHYTVSFMHSPEHIKLDTTLTTATFDVWSSLWHFYKYLNEYPKLVIEYWQEGVKRGVGNIHLPSILSTRVTKCSTNIMKQTLKEVTIFESSGDQECGVIVLTIWAQFNPCYTSTICGIIDRDLVSSEVDPPSTPPISRIALKSQHEINLGFPDEDNAVVVHNVAKSKDGNGTNQKTMEEEMNLEIDKIIQEMQSKVYNSSKYQDETTTSHPQAEQRTMPTKLQVIEYTLQSTNNNVSDRRLENNPSYRSLKSYPSHCHVNSRVESNPSYKIEAKTLKMQVYELGFAGGVISPQQLQGLSRSQLRITFPNGYSVGVPGVLKGETVIFRTEQEIPVEQSESPSGCVLFEGDEQSVTFVVSSCSNGRELAFGLFEMERLFRFEGGGTFIIGMNNRNMVSKSSSRVTLSTKELKTLRPINVSMYNLRVGFELVSPLKNKVYQLLLSIDQLQLQHNQETLGLLEIRYKTLGNLDCITVKNSEGGRLNHNMVMPVLLETLVRDNPKIVMEVWGGNTIQSLIGIVEASVAGVIKLTNMKTGTFNDTLLNANLDPIALEKGYFPIKSILSKQSQGSIKVGLYFGTPKQINSQLERLRKHPDEGKEKTVDRLCMPFDDQLGVFIKEKKKEVREVQTQAEFQKETGICQAFDTRNLLLQQQEEEESEEGMEPFVIESSAVKKYQTTRNQETNEFLDHTTIQVYQPEPSQCVEPGATKEAAQSQAQTDALKQTVPAISLTQMYISNIEHVLKRILSVNPNFLRDIKDMLKPHIHFNFVENMHLKRGIEEAVSIDFETINQLLKILVLGEDEGLTSITPLYDYFNSILIGGCVDPKLVSEDLLGDYILVRLVETSLEQGHQSCFIQEEEDVKDVFLGKGIMLTLRQRDVFWRRWQAFDINSVEVWRGVFLLIEREIRSKRNLHDMREEQEKQIHETLYSCNQQPQSKRQYVLVILKGMESCIESISCLLSISIESAEIRLSILEESVVFREDSSNTIDLSRHNLRQEEFEYQNATARLYVNGKCTSETTFSLEHLALGDMTGTYSFKDINGSFCGLIRLNLTYVQ